MSSSAEGAALRYEEPGIVTVLILSSFILFLNAINCLLDSIVYCGLIGQILVGVAYGVPGLDWLSRDVQSAVTQLGYLGLILIVYEGGLATNLPTLKANLFLSVTVAFIGISTPVALSFILLQLLDITTLQAFAAGAALCSTSLGTTFTVLTTSGLTESRLGTVLTSAAMMDDIIGLVMVQVIASLGGSSDLCASTIIRPIGVSIAFVVLLPLLCRMILKPLTQRYAAAGRARLHSAGLPPGQVRLVLDTLVLIAFLTAASYAGTSNLFTAYLAGVVLSWWDGLDCQGDDAFGTDGTIVQDADPSEPTSTQSPDPQPVPTQAKAASKFPLSPSVTKSKYERSRTKRVLPSGRETYHRYFDPAVTSILKPFFFASLGFSIPITKMFTPAVVWRGLVYTALMALGKMLCGICLVRFHGPIMSLTSLKAMVPVKLRSDSSPRKEPTASQRTSAPRPSIAAVVEQVNATQPASNEIPIPSPSPEKDAKPSSNSLPKPQSLYPSAILGMAMVARGEIGFLISSTAEANGVYDIETPSIGGGSSGDDQQLFMVVTWAILLCTILGPISVGLLVKRVRRLQVAERAAGSGKEDPLGIWGVAGEK